MKFFVKTYDNLTLNLCTSSKKILLWLMISLLSYLSVDGDEENAKSNNSSNIFLQSKKDKALGEECLLPTECLRSPHVTCHLRHCSCEEGYHESGNNTCVSDSNIKDGFAKFFEGSPMLPIVIVLVVMFVGICVALNLFSRARFRNSRSIFVNPRLLKLAKAQERRASQLSQLSGHQSGLRSPTNSFRSPRNSFSSPTHSYNGKFCNNHVLDPKRSPNRSRSNSTSSLQMHLRA